MSYPISNNALSAPAEVSLGPGGDDFSYGWVTSTGGTRLRLSQWMQEFANIPTNVVNYGAIGDGVTHPLSSVNSYLGVNTTGYTLAEWQTIFPFATSLTNELNWCAFSAARLATPNNGTVNAPAASVSYYGYNQSAITQGPTSVLWVLNGNVIPGGTTPITVIGSDVVQNTTPTAEFFSAAQVGGTSTLGNASANYLTIAGAITGSGPTITAAGSDTNIYVRAIPKGTGALESLRGSFGTINGVVGLFDTSPALFVDRNPIFTTTAGPGIYTKTGASGSVTSGTMTLHSFNINTDTVNTTGAGGPNAGVGYYFGHNVVAGATGGRTAVEILLEVTGAVTAGTVEPFYVAFGPSATANSSAGGISGTPMGALFAGNPQSILQTGAGLYWKGLNCYEFDVAAQSGTGVFSKRAVSIVQLSSDAVQGSSHDAALLFVNQPSGTAPGWKTLIQIGGYEGWFPGDTTNGAIINTEAATVGGGPSYALKYGIKIDGITFGTSAFQSNGFLVDGSGNETVLTTTTHVYTVATLPAVGTHGRRAAVSDATATTFGTTVAGGGTNYVPVFDNGTNWIIG